MKTLSTILVVVGVVLLLVAVVGGVSANPSRVFHIKISSVILVANTAFLLAILAKMCDKK